MSEDRLEELKRSPRVLDLYRQRVKLKKESGELVGLCPFHSEKSGSFHVYEHENTYLWKCFGCSKAGNVFQFIERYDRISMKAAIALVRDHVGGDTSWEEAKKKSDETFKGIVEEEEVKEDRSFALDVYEERLGSKLKGSPGMAWLQRERGIDYATASSLHLGYKQDIGKLAGEKNRDIADKGWIAFPSIEDGKVVSIKFRSIQRKCFTRVSGMATALFNTDAIEPLEPVFVVEGELDACALQQAGFSAVSLPSASTKLDAKMKEKLMSAESRFLAGDNDEPGREAMERIYKNFSDNKTFTMQWPEGMKDANQTLVEYCKGNVDKFRRLVEELVGRAKSQPMPYVYSLAEAMMNSGRTNLLDHPQRLRFPWAKVDSMAVLLPGSVISVVATNTKMGKSAWVMNATLEAARRQGEIVLNYQCELNEDEFSNMVAAYVLSKDRNMLTREDYKEAARKLAGVKYYVGRNPSLSTAEPVLDLIEAGVKRLNPTIVVLDHIHFICRNVDNEIQAQANAMQRITRMAQQYGLKFFVVGQPRKSLQQNRGKAIHITDIKGSETLSSDVHAAFSIHRDFIPDKEIDPNNPPDDAYLPKTGVKLLASRFKGPGAAYTELMFHGKFAAFRDEIPVEAVPVEVEVPHPPKTGQRPF